MGVQRTCDRCGRPETGLSVDITRYTLRTEIVRQQKDGVREGRVQKSAGGIDLCLTCWEKVAKPRMNPRKAHRNGLHLREG